MFGLMSTWLFVILSYCNMTFFFPTFSGIFMKFICAIMLLVFFNQVNITIWLFFIFQQFLLPPPLSLSCQWLLWTIFWQWCLRNGQWLSENISTFPLNKGRVSFLIRTCSYTSKAVITQICQFLLLKSFQNTPRKNEHNCFSSTSPSTCYCFIITSQL